MVVTGASSGFGRSMTELLLKKGDNVFATARDPSTLADLTTTYPAKQLVTAALDVTSATAITTAFAQAKSSFGQIDVVFNNAGQNLVGEVEAVPDEMARKLMEINFWGAVGVSREAIKTFREVNPAGAGGVLLQMSSAATSYSAAGMSYYAASKWAIEGFSESLSREMDPKWNIKIITLEPGWFKTDIFKNTSVMPSHPAYNDPASALMQVRGIANGVEGGASVESANALIYKLASGEVEVQKEHMTVPVGEQAFWLAKKKLEALKMMVEIYEPLSAGI
ncbi:NAD(P)-binding protein [Hygrophoropsis aurantiaca]|uniref:NAD(P)-binding protein n=1 Tax=Hygrophoropsis aurantiaca TaxID=72124 RepID=A0ACB7ZZV6_9AGAM|nr:NAD(P)-binding protein [Hygrophoropsis aurantiaca]